MLYRVAKFICRTILILIRRWQVQGSENVPRTGGAILICNHISYWDPVVIGCAINRPIFFMAKAELFEIPLLGPVITRLGAFPVHRNGNDSASVRHSLQLLKGGRIIGIFPEGTRSPSGELLDFHRGAALLAVKTGVPMVPAAVSGTAGFFGRVYVSIGKPVKLEGTGRGKNGRNELEKASREIMAEVELLRRLHKNSDK